jgi:outer membrane protein assembly factor BamB
VLPRDTITALICHLEIISINGIAFSRTPTMVRQFPPTLLGVIAAILAGTAYADDWPMLGRDGTRNAVSPEKDPPTFWRIEKAPEWDELGELRALAPRTENVRWFAELGVHTFSTPVVDDGLIWVGTANSRAGNDRPSLLKCFRESDGKLLYQYESMPLGAYSLDAPWLGISCTPLVEGDRVWLVNNRVEAVCLDIGPLKRGEGSPVVAWKRDMRKDWGVSPYTTVMGPGPVGSVAVYKNLLYVLTGNVDRAQRKLLAPDAPSLVCLDKFTGELVWQDKSPGVNILQAQWGAPLVAEIEGRAQVIVPQGDSWLRAFDALSGTPIWWFDINPKESRWLDGGRGDRNYFLTAPVLYDGRIYIASGQEMEHGEGYGRLVCIDPTKNSDVSSELAVDAEGKPIEHRRIQAVDRDRGEQAVRNPNSALVWQHGGMSLDEFHKLPFEDQMHRSMSNVAINDGLLVAVDFSGLVTCLDAKTGKRYWRHDLLSAVLTSPLIIDGKAYILDEDGEMNVFQLSREADADGDHPPIAEFVAHPAPSGASPIFANGTLYVAGRRVLLAVANQNQTAPATDEGASRGHWPQWRGPRRDNISQDAGLAKQWPSGGPPLRWRVSGLGDGISTVSVAGGLVFALGQYDTTEFVHALDEATGKHRWTAILGESPPQSPVMRWLTQRPPTVDNDRVYAVSLPGELACMQAADGKELWRKNYAIDFAGVRGLFGYSDCPLVHGEKLICTPGGAEASLVALDKRTGETLWKCAIPDAGHAAYGNGIITQIAGRVQIIAFFEKSLVSVAVDDGALLWRKDGVVDVYVHPHTPLIRDESIICVNSFGKPGLNVLEVKFDDGWRVKEIASAPSNHLARLQDDTVLLNEKLYDTSTNVLSCFDIRTAAPVWQQRLGKTTPAMTCAGGQLYLHYSDGMIRLIDIAESGPEVRGELPLPDHQNSFGTSTPVVTGGSLYIREDAQLFCYNVREGASPAVDAPGTIVLSVPARPPGNDEGSRQSRVGKDRAPDAIFVPTPHDVVEKMLDLAGVKESDMVYDLGSGDGRIVIAAAKRGARAVGYEIDPELVKLAREKVRENLVEDKASIEHEDIFTLDLSRADVICSFLYPRLMEKLIPQLEKLKPGSRIVSHQFEMPGVKPDRVITVNSAESGSEHKLYLWATPLKKLETPK